MDTDKIVTIPCVDKVDEKTDLTSTTASLVIHKIGFDELLSQGQDIVDHLQRLVQFQNQNGATTEQDILLHAFASFQLIHQNLQELLKKCSQQVKNILPFVQAKALTHSLHNPHLVEPGVTVYSEQKRETRRQAIDDDLLYKLDLSDKDRKTLLSHSDRQKKKSPVTLTLLTKVLGKSEAKKVWSSSVLFKNRTFLVCKAQKMAVQVPRLLSGAASFSLSLPSLHSISSGRPLSLDPPKSAFTPVIAPVKMEVADSDFDPFVGLSTSSANSSVKKQEKKEKLEIKETPEKTHFEPLCDTLAQMNKSFFDNPLKGIVPGVVPTDSGSGKPKTKDADEKNKSIRRSKLGASDSESELTSSDSESGSDSDSDRRRRKRKRNKKLKRQKT